MEVCIYSIKDTVAQEFGPIFQAKNDDVALRNFHSALLKVPNPEEYELYYLGTFDVDTGSLYGGIPNKVEDKGVKVDE